MSDLISRQAAIDAVRGLPTWWADAGGYYGDAQPPMVALLDPEDTVSAIENLPSAQPERKKGKWIYDKNGVDWNLGAWVCSECHCRNDNIPPAVKFGNEYKRIADPNMWQGSNFCPNCGCDMRGDQE